MTNRRIAWALALSALLISGSWQYIAAGTTGKIHGVVREQGSGAPLPSVNVIIDGTTLGAATDQEGYYFVTNVPPGVYRLRASIIGYQSMVVENVKVSINLSTELNFDLQESVLELSESVTVVAERPMVQKDVTAKMAIIDGETIANRLPVTTLGDVLAIQAGFLKDENGQLHVRGGRTGEIGYYIDGVLAQNPFDRGFGAELEADAISELEVLSGAFSAEYGNALSAIVNVVTKDGGDKLTGKLQYESDMLNASPYHQKDWLLTLDNVKALPLEQQLEYLDAVRDSLGNSTYEFVSVLDDPHVSDYTVAPILGTLSGNLSGPVPGISRLSFFLSGRFKNENSQLPYGYDLLRLGTAKLTYRLAPHIKLSYRGELSRRYTQDYVHNYKYYRYNELTNQGSYPVIEQNKQLHSISWIHTVSPATFYTLQGSWLSNREDNKVPDRAVISDPETGELISSDYLTRLFYRGIDSNFRLGDVRYWDETESKTLDLKFDMTSQAHRHHQLKAGAEWKEHSIFRHQIGMPPRGQREYFEQKPTELAVYLQDKVEYDFMILNLGLRYDVVDPKATTFEDPAFALQRTVDDKGQAAIVEGPRQAAPVRTQLSPRVGLAHPVTARTVLYFSYGHFFQFPRYYDLYRNNSLEDLLANDALVGNPGLEPEKTIAFEVGIKQQLATDLALDVTAYSKDIDNLVSSFFYFTEGRGYTIFTNADFGRVQGIDFSLVKRPSHYFSAQLNYSLSVARGNESDPLEGFNSFREEDAHLRPNRDFYLDFDRRHDLSANVDFVLPSQFGPRLGSWHPFANTGLNVLFQLSSGLPYTPSSREGDEATLNPEKNSARKPWNHRLDLRAYKDFSLAATRLRFFLIAENVLDQVNVDRVWTATGDPWDQGPTSILPKDRQANPENTGARRSIRLGAFIDF